MIRLDVICTHCTQETKGAQYSLLQTSLDRSSVGKAHNQPDYSCTRIMTEGASFLD